ncbi:hypothetical protein CRUP_016066 [Coryphaenoides rupestris]|nr:hypothetical protein CRUP_016066 [Coryphaenoides rupestris]
MKESRKFTVALPFLLASELEALIGCSYSGALPLSWECVFEITGTSLQFQYQPALSLCLNFLQNEISPSSCLDVASFAKAYDMERLLKLADDFTLRQFQRVSRTAKFNRELWFGNSQRNHTGIVKSMEWRRLGEMPEPSRLSHEVAVLNGQLYVIGGRKYYGREDILNSAYRYDPLGNGWERLSDMREQRCCFSLVVLDEMLFAIGGDSHPGCLESVERYCPATNSWSFTCPLNTALTGHTAKVLDKQIFVCGGFDGGYQCRVSTTLYHPEERVQPPVRHEPAARAPLHGGPRRHLYVAGGVTTGDDGDTMATVNQLACEVYNPAADCWTAFQSLAVPHVGAGCAVLEGRFYVLGGYSQRDDSDTHMVHRYDPATQRWENMGGMPGPNTDIRAAILSLPPQLRCVGRRSRQARTSVTAPGIAPAFSHRPPPSTYTLPSRTAEAAPACGTGSGARALHASLAGSYASHASWSP